MLSVLLLEPCARTRRSMLRVLTRSGFQCATADNVEDAIGRVEAERTNLFLADVDALRSAADRCVPFLRRVAPNLRILLLSGGRPHESQHPCCPATCTVADGVLLKPFENEQLLAALVRLIRPSTDGPENLKIATTSTVRDGRRSLHTPGPATPCNSDQESSIGR